MSATIAAVATPAGPGGVGVLRISGPAALEVCLPLCPKVPPSPTPRHAYLSPLCDRRGGVLDAGLFLFFAAPASYTGEDVVELHAHGSPALLRLLLRAVLEDGRVRLASPGEFTRRAFLHGKLDLSAAEAVADLIAAESEVAVRAAAAQVHGGLAARVREVLAPLRALHADVEGVLDFPDEAEGADAGLAARLSAVRASLEALVEGAARGRLVRRGARVALFGPPNAGKSTLFNALLAEARALVDEEPGTTRDVLEARLELGGLAVTLLDTAGLREAPSRVERLGVERARQALAGADVALLVLPEGTSPEEVATWAGEAAGVSCVHVRSKADLVSREVLPLPQGEGRGEGSASHAPFVSNTSTPFTHSLRVSGLTGEGVVPLRTLLLQLLLGEDVQGAVLVTSERHADALRRAAEALARAEAAAQLSTLEAVAGEVALAHEALGEITGESATEALLDALFARFCIGK